LGFHRRADIVADSRIVKLTDVVAEARFRQRSELMRHGDRIVVEAARALWNQSFVGSVPGLYIYIFDERVDPECINV